MRFSTTCISCGGEAITTGEVTAEQLAKHAAGGLAQDVFTNLNMFDREVIISHTCHSCQERIFNRPAPGHEAAFGNSRGECDCCGAPLWDKDERDSILRCPACGMPQGLEPEQYEDAGEWENVSDVIE